MDLIRSLSKLECNFDEHEIIKEIVNGKTWLFREIVNRYQHRVASIVGGFVLGRAEVEEITQEVFCNLYVSLKRFRYDAQLGTYIYRMAVNIALKWNRKNSRVVYVGDYSVCGNGLSGDDGYDSMILDERKKMLTEAISKLPDNQKAALTLYNFEGMKYKEIAQILNVSVPAVESLIFRAKVNLKRMLLSVY